MKMYQVWHDRGWPQSRLNQTLGGWPPSRYPNDYVHVANVKANGLRHVVELTTGKGSFLDSTFQGWEANSGVESLSRFQRDTDRGDVIVAPDGKPYRVEENFFKEISAEQGKLGKATRALFEEIRADEAAAKREDAHWYGKLTYRETLDEKAVTPAAEKGKDQGIER
jgi:hypothetical protein